MTRRLLRGAPLVWAVLLCALLLGPALGRGYVLSYDMVWVPHLALDRDVLGFGSGLPRAVPSDAVIAVLDNVITAMLLQKLVLAGSLLLAAGGALRLVPESLVARLVAVSLTVWSPFAVERLWMGHWPVLLGYAAVPWLVEAGRRAAAGRVPRWTYAVLLLGSLSANAGIVSALALLVTGWRRRGIGVNLRLIAACLAANAPWVVAGLLHATQAQDATGYGLFSLHGDALPAPLAALTLGGIWNHQVVPGSRQDWLAWLALGFVVALAVAGAGTWWRRMVDRDGGRRQGGALIALWAVGFGIAVYGWAFPSALSWIGGQVPGVALFRDGSRSLALCLPLLVALVASGAERVARAAGSRLGQLGVGVAVVLIPVMVMADAAWGVGNVLQPVRYPAEWAAARAVLDQRPPASGDVLLLPFSAYRAPEWNHGRPVLDPLGRYLGASYVADDDLVVSGTVIAGEDPRAPEVSAALARSTPGARAEALGALGIGWVVTELDAPDVATAAPVVAGTPVHVGPLLRLVRLAPQHSVSAGVSARLVAAWAAFLALVAAAFIGAIGDLWLWSQRATLVVRRGRGPAATVRD